MATYLPHKKGFVGYVSRYVHPAYVLIAVFVLYVLITVFALYLLIN